MGLQGSNPPPTCDLRPLGVLDRTRVAEDEPASVATDSNADERLTTAEARQQAAEAQLWQLPGLAITAQSFLLGAGLTPNAAGWAQILVGILGIGVVFAVSVVVASQSIRWTVLWRWVEVKREKPLDEKKLVNDLQDGDFKLNWFQRFLLENTTGGKEWLWLIVAIAFLGADLYVLGRGLGLVG